MDDIPLSRIIAVILILAGIGVIAIVALCYLSAAVFVMLAGVIGLIAG